MRELGHWWVDALDSVDASAKRKAEEAFGDDANPPDAAKARTEVLLRRRIREQMQRIKALEQALEEATRRTLGDTLLDDVVVGGYAGLNELSQERQRIKDANAAQAVSDASCSGDASLS